ncbi:MAG: rhodanese-like domain-containing protein, partial [Rubrobacter sp.]
GEGFVLVDVLGEPHYRHSHLPGAINVPLEDLEGATGLLPDRDAEIVVYCMSRICSASGEAARELANMGYHYVRDYAGGKQDWIGAGLPYEGAHKRRTQR